MVLTQVVTMFWRIAVRCKSRGHIKISPSKVLSQLPRCKAAPCIDALRTESVDSVDCGGWYVCCMHAITKLSCTLKLNDN